VNNYFAFTPQNPKIILQNLISNFQMADKELEDFILNLNREAMNYLKQENFQLSLKTLKDAEKLLKTLNSSENIKLQGITLNNFGCFYKRINKPNVALKFLQRACEKESLEPVDRVNLAGTLLNMCAIYSQLGKHDQALDEGIKALTLLEQETMTSPNLASTLIIAYHNTGVEYEYLSNLKQAVECYKSAWTFAVKQMGENNNLTGSIHKTYVDALEKLEKNEMKASFREQVRISHKVKGVEKRGQTAFPAIRKNKETREMNEVNPYVKVKQAPPPIPKQSKKPEKSILEKAPVLNQVRFLTGDRLQPMFQNKTQAITIRPIGQIRDEKSLAPVNPRRNKEKISELYESSDDSKQEVVHIRTSSAPVNINVGNLQQRIRSLESKYEDFDKKIQPLKESLPELEGFKMQNISALYEMEKIAELDNKRKKIEEEKEKFLQHVKRMDEIEAKLKNDKENQNDYEKNKSLKEKEEKIGKDDDEGKGSEGMKGEEKEEVEKKPEDFKEFSGTPEKIEKNVMKAIKTPLTVTQGVFKGYLRRKKLDKRTLAAIVIQKHVRRHQCRNIYKEIREAIIFIQRFYRKYRAHKLSKITNPSN
jgi:hypothetical protein